MFFEHNRAGVLVLEHSMIGKEKSIICMSLAYTRELNEYQYCNSNFCELSMYACPTRLTFSLVIMVTIIIGRRGTRNVRTR